MPPRRPIAIALLVLLAAGALAAGLLVGSGGDSDGGDEIPEAARRPQAERTSFLAQLIPPEAEDEDTGGPRAPRTIRDLARRLPLERKVAQLFLFGFRGQTLEAPIYGQLRRLDLGGVVFDRQNYTDAQTLGMLANEATNAAVRVRHVPPFVMAPQIGGEFSAFADLPPGAAPADLGTPRAGGAAAADAASALRGLGINGVLAPVVDVGLEVDPAFGARVFSDDPRTVAAYASQTVSAYNRGRMLSTPSHFPGLGAASVPTEEGPATVGLTAEELKVRDLVPFRAAIRAGAPAVLVGHGLYPFDDFVVPASLSKNATELLRVNLGFKGLAITDDLADPPITALSSVPEAAVQAIDAGNDMLYISGPPGDQQAAYVAVLRAVQRKRISRDRLDEAVIRILSAKRRFGLIRR